MHIIRYMNGIFQNFLQKIMIIIDENRDKIH